MIFVEEDIPSKLLSKYNFPSDIEGLFIGLKSKWLFLGTYYLTGKSDQYFLVVSKKLLVFTETMKLFY